MLLETYLPATPAMRAAPHTARTAAISRALETLEYLLQDWCLSQYDPEVATFLKTHVVPAVPRNALIPRNLAVLVELHTVNPEIRDFYDNIEFHLFAKLNFMNAEYDQLIESLASGIAETVSDVNRANIREHDEIIQRRTSFSESTQLLRANRWLVVYFLLTLVRPAVLQRFIQAQTPGSKGVTR